MTRRAPRGKSAPDAPRPRLVPHGSRCRQSRPRRYELAAFVVWGEKPESLHGGDALTKKHFPKGKYDNFPGLCKVASIAEIEAQGWSLNPGRYVGVADREADDFDFAERLEELNEELETLNLEAHRLETRIAENVAGILEGKA